MKKKILLADDHSIVIEGIRAVLSGHDDIEVVGEMTNGQEVLDYLDHGGPVDVVVLDINMPVMDGLTCAKKIKYLYTKVKVIILTMYAQKSFTEEMLKIGVDGCLLKNNTGKELKDAIDRVYNGRSYFDLIHTFSSESNEIINYKLSEREIEIIKLLAEGLTSQQIAEKLFISDHTVRTHRKNILRKTELHNTSQLVQFALNNQLI